MTTGRGRDSESAQELVGDVAAPIRIAARQFVAAALPVLRNLRLFPPPQSNPFVGVGHEYFGADLNLPEHAVLAAAIKAAHPRFDDRSDVGERDVATSYTHTFIEACVTYSPSRVIRGI